MVNSMTGFATMRGELDGWAWVWDMRAVNARGFDLRLRLPDWLEGLDVKTRSAVGKHVTRGTVTLGLKLTRDTAEFGEKLNRDALARVFGHLAEINSSAGQAGVELAPTSAADIISLRGILVSDNTEDDAAPLISALEAELPILVNAFNQMRQTEGAALSGVLSGQLDHIADLTAQAGKLADARKDQMASKLRENLSRILDNTDGADAGRVAQELALIAVKSDVTEEIDRLDAHVSAARELLASSEAIGRKLDFLSQEFNREANTLCSKAQSADLTRVGLDLKATIDQMREQVQNVE